MGKCKTHGEVDCPVCAAKRSTQKVNLCEATHRMERCCDEPADDGSRFCGRHAYIDGRSENPNQYYDGPGVTFKPPPRPQVFNKPRIDNSDMGGEAPEDYWVKRALMRHITTFKPIDDCIADAYEAAARGDETDAWDRQRIKQWLRRHEGG